jgi:hypothetical protein
MHEQLDCKCSSGGSIYIHEEGGSDGVIDSWNGNGDLQAILICKSIYRVAVLEPSRWRSRHSIGSGLQNIRVDALSRKAKL